MSPDEIQKAVVGFLSLVTDKTYSSHETRQKSLIESLDRIALAYHFSSVPLPDQNGSDAPPIDVELLRQKVKALFPNCGYYNIVTDISVNVGSTTVGVADSIADIVRIAENMSELLWLWHNVSQQAALYQLSWGYQNYWGDDLRSLQLYLKATQRQL